MLALLLAVSVTPVPKLRTPVAPPVSSAPMLLTPAPALAVAAPQLTLYKAAPSVQTAAAVFEAMGERTEPVTAQTWSGVFDGLRVAPAADGGALNKLSAGVLKRLEAVIDVLPGRTGGAAFNSADKRIMPDLGAADFYEGLLHESRHAWYAKKQRQGEIRLFHVQAVARPGRVLAPGALAYEGYMSFEELSTFPKTLRHLASKKDKDLALNRYWHTLNIMRTAAYLAEEANLRRGQTQDVGDGYGLGLVNAELYFPRSPDPHARWDMTLSLIVDNVAPLQAYKAAVEAGDWKGASAAADKMVARVRKAETDWLRRPAPAGR